MRPISSTASSTSLSSGMQRPSMVLVATLLLACASAISSAVACHGLLLCVFLLLPLTTFIPVCARFVAEADRDIILQLAVGCIGFSLLFSSTLLSGDLLGWDVHQEFNLSMQVLTTGVWHPEIQAQYNSVLSITVLPAVISAVSGVDLVSIFKFLFPGLFCLVPVVLYRFYRSLLSPEASFLSSFLLVSYPAFYLELISLARQEIATIFLALILLTFSYRRIGQGPSGMIITMVLTVGIVTAHYSLAYVYLLLLAVSFLISAPRRSFNPLVRPAILLLTAVITLYWYAFVVSPFELLSLGQLFSWLVNGVLYDFFNPFSRPAILSMALGQYRRGLLGDLNRVLYYAVNLTMVIGFLVLARRREKTTAERRMFPLWVLAFAILGLSVVLPYFAASLDIERIYALVLVLASPCFAIGAEAYSLAARRIRPLLGWCSGVRGPSFEFKWVPAAALLLCYFLFTSGWVWAVTMSAPSSFILDSKRMATYPDDSVKAYFYSYYTAPQDIASARWLRLRAVNRITVCADWNARLNVLASYGGLSRGPSSEPLLPSGCDFENSYVYLSLLNTLYGIGTQGDWSVSLLPLGTLNRVYSDGSTIYVA